MKILKQTQLIGISVIMLLAVYTIAHETAYAQEISEDSHTLIQNKVQSYLLSQLQQDTGTLEDEKIVVEITPIDNRINIPQCPSDFEFSVDSASLAQSYLTVRVSCLTNDWYIFTSAKVTRTRSIVVTRSMVSPGTVLTSDNLALADVDVKQLRHTPYSTAEQLIGARMKYRVRESQPIQSNMLCFVCKGDRITITAQTGGMRVKTSGIARQDGVVGDAIRVQNASSQKTIIAEVVSTQEVVVNL